MKNYNVNFIGEAQLKITGKCDNIFWKNAEVLTDFISAWDTEIVKRIEFKALWDVENLSFCFKVYDNEVHIDKNDDCLKGIGNSDRVELFFRTDARLNPYYCLEIDPTPRIMDFIAYPNKKFDFNWNWPQNDILVKSHRAPNYFTVEGAISLASLKRLNLLNNNKIEIGIFRAKYNKQENASFEPTWISWVNPKTETPNFHISTSFGNLNLIKK